MEPHFGSYEERTGLFVPTEGEVGWYFDNEWQAVWKGRITAFEAQRAKELDLVLDTVLRGLGRRTASSP